MALLALLLLLLQADPHREKIDKGVTFPDAETVAKVAAQSEWHKKVLAVLVDKDHWTAALKAMELRTGVTAGDLDITVKFAALKDVPARAFGKAGKGAVELDIDRIAKYERTVADCDKLKAKGVVVIVPPARVERIIPHEITHCFQGVDQPAWFIEGMASYVGRETNHVYAYRHGGGRTLDIAEPYERDFLYARSWAFFEWMESAHGVDKVKKFIALSLEGKAASDAAAEATGIAWEELRKKERDGAATWIRKFKADR